MTRFVFCLSTFLFLNVVTAHAAHVLWSDDYENGSHGGYFGSTLNGTIVANPFVGDGNYSATVFQVSDASNSSPWGELRANNGSMGSFALASIGAIPGVDTYTFSVDYFIPQDTVSRSADGLTLLIRTSLDANSSPYSATSGTAIATATAQRGVWKTLTMSGKIATDFDTTTPGLQTPFYITPMIALSDAPSSGATGDNPAGIWIYYDNLRFAVTPEPSKTLLFAAGLGLLFLRRKRL